jgi:hypothetical protein
VFQAASILFMRLCQGNCTFTIAAARLDCLPSQADVALTDKVRKAALTMDIKLLDHLIITDDQFYSFADLGKL